MSPIFPPVELQFGDCLLYDGPGLVDFIIRLKTWSPCAHVEVYIGNGQSVASRNGIGVNKYPLRSEGLIAVLRPKLPLDREAGMAWFYKTACGQGYAFWSLLAFWFAKWKADPKRMFCSEFACNWYRAGGFEPFAPDLDADHVSPGLFITSGEFTHIWKNF